jgi:predicted ATPase
VVVFGVPVVAEDDAERAVRCGHAMVAELAALDDELDRGWGVRLRMRVGVNTGELVISGEGELVGDAMNTAARFEQAAAPGEVLVGEQTWRLTRHTMRLAPVPPLVLKGKSEPVRAWRLVATDPPPEEPPARAEAPLVGRSGELDRLSAVPDEACAVRGARLVTVIGSPGMGKTRLVEEFALAVRDRAAVVRGRCEPSGAGVTFGPVAELLRDAADIGETDPPDTVRAKLDALVAGEPDAERIADRAGSLLGVADPASVQETFWGVRRALEALARRRPLVVLLEDLHWGQPLLLDLVQHLAEWVRDAPMLLLVLSRPELRETREALTVPGRPVSEVLELAPLGSGESRTFVEVLLGPAELPFDLLDRILDTTEGNPLFLGETLRMLLDDGTLTRDGETWVTAAGAAFAVPPTIQGLLAARLERLRHDERAVVERAAVIGKQFYRGAVAELVSAPVRVGLDGHLETLRRKEMVEPDGTYWVDEPVYRFHHVLIRDAAYRSLLKEARAELHERFADWLAAKSGELVGEHEEVIAFHLEQAHEYRRQLGALDAGARTLATRAAAMLASAGRRALTRADLAAAANLLARAAARTDTDDPELLWDWAETLLSAGDAAGAGEVVERRARSSPG